MNKQMQNQKTNNHKKQTKKTISTPENIYIRLSSLTAGIPKEIGNLDNSI